MCSICMNEREEGVYTHCAYCLWVYMCESVFVETRWFINTLNLFTFNNSNPPHPHLPPKKR